MSRVAPAEFRDEVELFARQHGGHGDIQWVPAPVSCWQVRLSLKPGDPRLRHPDEGTHFETVELHEWVDPKLEPAHPKLHLLRRSAATNEPLQGYVAIELDELGVGGLRELLEKGSLLSGRGEYSSAEAAAKAVADRHRNLRERARQKQRESVAERALDRRRQILKIPYHRVGIDLQER